MGLLNNNIGIIWKKTNRSKEALHMALAGPKMKRLTVIKSFSLQVLPSKIQQLLFNCKGY